MTAERAIDAARARLAQLGSEEQRAAGELEQARAASSSVPEQARRGLTLLASSGALQRRWDAAVAGAESRCEDGRQGLLEALMEVFDEVVGLSEVELARQELAARRRASELAAERRILEWLVQEADRDQASD